tara:strand:+ start:821 stop:1294 length:474 start_codon:yes stop_codon:yes gene_type:complete
MEKKRKSKKELLYFDEYGILRFDLGGKVLLLFLTEIAAVWMSFILLAKWNYFNDTKHGLAIIISNVIFLGITFTAIFFKGVFVEVHQSEMAKQVANLLFFVMVFLIIYYYSPEEIDQKIREREPDTTLYFYTNPVNMTYVFILVYLICFYILFNSTK